MLTMVVNRITDMVTLYGIYNILCFKDYVYSLIFIQYIPLHCPSTDSKFDRKKTIYPIYHTFLFTHIVHIGGYLGYTLVEVNKVSNGVPIPYCCYK